MAFDQSTITDLVITQRDAELGVTWKSSAPAGTVFQVYINKALAWHGTRRSATVPYPSVISGRSISVDVGAVADAELLTDFSASLPTPPGGGGRFLLEWEGGAFLSPNIAGFHIYLGDSPGAAVDYARIVDTVPAYLTGIYTDGFGLNGFGSGGFGSGGAEYEWTSPPLPAGTWHAGIRSFDTAGNEGTTVEETATLAGPPQPPALNAQGQRLTFTATSEGFGLGGMGEGEFGGAAGLPFITLSWLASPGL